MDEEIEILYHEALLAIAEGEADEALARVSEMIDVAPNDPRTIEVQGDLARSLHEPETAEEHYRRLLKEAPDDVWRGIAHMSLGSLFAETGSADSVREHFAAARGLFNLAGATEKAAEASVTLGCFEQEAGDFSAAATTLQSAIDLIEQSNEPEEFDGIAATAKKMLGTCQRLQGRLNEAQETLNQALRLFQKLEEPDECADILDALGVLEQIHGHYDAAETLHLKAVEVNEAVHHQEGLSVNYGNLTLLNIHREKFDAAAEWANKAYALDQELGDDNGIAHYHLLMGEIEAERDNLEAAEDHLKQCVELYRECGDAEDEMCAQGKFAVLYSLQGRLDEAAEINEQILKTAESMGHADGVAAILEHQGQVRKAQGRIDDARECWERSLAAYKELESEEMMKEVERHLAELD